MHKILQRGTKQIYINYEALDLILLILRAILLLCLTIILVIEAVNKVDIVIGKVVISALIFVTFLDLEISIASRKDIARAKNGSPTIFAYFVQGANDIKDIKNVLSDPHFLSFTYMADRVSKTVLPYDKFIEDLMKDGIIEPSDNLIKNNDTINNIFNETSKRIKERGKEFSTVRRVFADAIYDWYMDHSYKAYIASSAVNVGTMDSFFYITIISIYLEGLLEYYRNNYYMEV